MLKKEKKSQNLYLTDYNSLATKDLWQVHYQILLIMLLKEFMKLNVNRNTMIKNLKIVDLNTKNATAFLNIETLKTI